MVGIEYLSKTPDLIKIRIRRIIVSSIISSLILGYVYLLAVLPPAICPNDKDVQVLLWEFGWFVFSVCFIIMLFGLYALISLLAMPIYFIITGECNTFDIISDYLLEIPKKISTWINSPIKTKPPIDEDIEIAMKEIDEYLGVNNGN